MAKCRVTSRGRANGVTVGSNSDMLITYYQSTHSSDGVTIVVSVGFQKFLKSPSVTEVVTYYIPVLPKEVNAIKNQSYLLK